MKKLFFTLAIIFLIMGMASAEEYTIKAKTITATAVSASASVSPTTWKFQIPNLEGSFGVQFQVAGSGTGTLAYALSNDGTNFFTPGTGQAGEGDIFTGITATSGGAGPNNPLDGIVIDDVSVEFAEWVQFYINETAGANPISVTATVIYR